MGRSSPLAVDWDGVVVGENGRLLRGAQDGLRELDRLYRPFVHTANVDHARIARTLRGLGLDWRIVHKPFAVAYLDDRAARFTGWESALDAVAGIPL